MRIAMVFAWRDCRGWRQRTGTTYEHRHDGFWSTREAYRWRRSLRAEGWIVRVRKGR
jgi:hypothetical protein